MLGAKLRRPLAGTDRQWQNQNSVPLDGQAVQVLPLQVVHLVPELVDDAVERLVLLVGNYKYCGYCKGLPPVGDQSRSERIEGSQIKAGLPPATHFWPFLGHLVSLSPCPTGKLALTVCGREQKYIEKTMAIRQPPIDPILILT